DSDPRQQTLRDTIEWSYDLLAPGEQQLFSRLSVFAGGCTLEAAEEVTGADLDTLQSLVEKSLLRLTDERFWMLATIREYGAERLEQAGEADVLRLLHAEWVRSFVEDRGRKDLISEYYEEFEREQENARSALATLLQCDPD